MALSAEGIKRRESLLNFEGVEGCWIWRGRINPNGYGRLGSGWAHRTLYEIHKGPIPDGYDLDHLCRTRACVNPTHLEPVTRSENLKRGEAGYNPKLCCRKLNEGQIRYIRASDKPNTVLGRELGVSHETVRRLRKQDYCEVPE